MVRKSTNKLHYLLENEILDAKDVLNELLVYLSEDVVEEFYEHLNAVYDLEEVLEELGE